MRVEALRTALHPRPADWWFAMNTKPRNDFEKWRDMWAAQVLKNRKLKARCKAVAWAISRHLNRHNRQAWPSQRTLAEEAGMSRTQVQFSIQQLEAHGHLTVKIGPARRKGNIHLIYEPKFAPSRAEVASGRGQGGPDVKAGVAPTSRPEPLIEPLTEPLIPISSISGATGVAPSIDESKKGNP